MNVVAAAMGGYCRNAAALYSSGIFFFFFLFFMFVFLIRTILTIRSHETNTRCS